MKRLLLIPAAGLLSACMNTPQPIVQNSNSTAPANERSQTAIAHGPSEKQPVPASNSTGGGSKWTQSGDPIDTASFDAAIAKAEKNPGDKKALAEAYLARANALTAARQYASALGDFRRTLKHDPANAEAKEWVDQITSIYASINRDSPKEGEEPPPLPFKRS